MSVTKVSLATYSSALLLIAVTGGGFGLADEPVDKAWVRVTEDANRVKIETDKLEAAIPKRNPKHWMTGIEKGSFLDKTTGFREIGDGLMVIDWLMESGSDEDYGDFEFAKDGHGLRKRRSYYASVVLPAGIPPALAKAHRAPSISVALLITAGAAAPADSN